MLKIKINNNKTLVFTQDKNRILINNKEINWDIIEIKNNMFHIIKDNRSYNAEVVEADFRQKKFVIKVNGIKHDIEVHDQFDLLLEKLGMNKSTAPKKNVVEAPMPGSILDIKVKEGDNVKKDDTLIILEAMKMENIIKSPGDGVIKSVKVRKGEGVEKGQVLMEFL